MSQPHSIYKSKDYMETILIAGGTGLIGSKLIELLRKDFQIKILSRSPKQDSRNITYHQWDVDKLQMDVKALECDYIINLTGAGIADSRWTNERKKILIDSRVNANKTLMHGLMTSGKRVKSIVCASAIGYYGDRGSVELTESSDAGKEFLSKCSLEWEASSMLLAPYAERLSILRIGIVLAKEGGALPKILMTKNIGVLAYFGSGKQYYSWIHINDICKMFKECLLNKQASGIYNAVVPLPLTNKDFTKVIAKSLYNPHLVVPAPAFALRLAMGEMANVVLNSNRVIPTRMTELGFEYEFEDLSKAIIDLTQKS